MTNRREPPEPYKLLGLKGLGREAWRAENSLGEWRAGRLWYWLNGESQLAVLVVEGLSDLLSAVVRFHQGSYIGTSLDEPSAQNYV